MPHCQLCNPGHKAAHCRFAPPQPNHTLRVAHALIPEFTIDELQLQVCEKFVKMQEAAKRKAQIHSRPLPLLVGQDLPRNLPTPPHNKIPP